MWTEVNKQSFHSRADVTSVDMCNSDGAQFRKWFISRAVQRVLDWKVSIHPLIDCHLASIALKCRNAQEAPHHHSFTEFVLSLFSQREETAPLRFMLQDILRKEKATPLPLKTMLSERR
jgi:hypothetical protein